MTDVHDKQTRQKNMSAIRNRNTKPEQIVAALLQEMDIAFQAQRSDIIGKPDLFVPQHQTAIFVHGCFWHGHDCHLFKVPQTRTEFWLEKIATNKARDLQVRETLNDTDFRQLIIWECSLKGSQKLCREDLKERIEEFLLSKTKLAEIRETGFNVRLPS